MSIEAPGHQAPAPVSPPVAAHRYSHLLDVLAELLDLPGEFRLSPRTALTRQQIDALACLLRAPGAVRAAPGTVEITGTLGEARIVIVAREGSAA